MGFLTPDFIAQNYQRPHVRRHQMQWYKTTYPLASQNPHLSAQAGQVNL